VLAVKRWTRILVGLGIALSLQTTAHAQTDRGYTTFHVGDPYRGSITFRSAPDLTLIPNTNVYTLRGDTDYDLYRYDGWYYMVDNGSWYRARSWREPFRYVEMGTVPRDVVTVPMRYRRTWSTNTSSSTSYTRSGRRYVIRETTGVRPGRRYRGTYLSFRTQPRMSIVPGTRVYYVHDNRFDRDLYRYGNNWYYVENGVWYAADTWRGPYFTMRWREVPASVRRLPSAYRRTWTFAGASDFDEDDDYYNDRATRTVVRVGDRSDFTLDMAPSMSIIPGSNVYYSRDEADYDLYRYGNSWYLADNGGWYRASSWRGPFLRIQAGSVPRAVFTIPSGYRKTWVPTGD
jgi:hypothetical protein